MELDYDKVTEERKALREKIEEQGAGAPNRWMTMAESASVGNKAAKAECVRLLGHQITSMLDLFNIQRAAFDAATIAEKTGAPPTRPSSSTPVTTSKTMPTSIWLTVSGGCERKKA